MVPGPAPATAEMLLLLLWGIECVRGQGSQAEIGVPTNPRSAQESRGLNDRYKLQVQKLVTVQEGLCVFIPCTFSYPPDGWNHSDPVLVYWFQKGTSNINHVQDVPVVTNDLQRKVKEETKGRFQLPGDPRANNCSLHITGAQKEDSGKYIFRMERGTVKFNYKKMLSVLVTALTNVPDIITGSLKSGHRSLLKCFVPWACDRGTPLTFSWMGAALRSQGSHSEAYNSSVITLTPGPQDHGTDLTCRVTFSGARVTTKRTVTLSVSYAPENVTIHLFQGNCTELKYLDYMGNHSSLSVMEGESLRLVCVADSNPPASQSWVRRSPHESPLQTSDLGVLELPRVQKEDEGEVTCEARNPLGSRRLSLSLSVLYAPKLQDPSCSWEAGSLRCICTVRAWPAPSVRWRLGDRLVEGNSSNVSVTSSSAGPWANSSLSLRGGLSSSLKLHCEACNDHGAHSFTVLLLPAGTPQHGGGFVQATFLAAGVTSLLFLCPCLLFLMLKALRRKATTTAAGRSDAPCHHYMGPLAEVSARQPPRQPILDGGPTHSGEEQELQYASLVFHGLRPREPPSQEAPSTEYAEIKIRQ